MKKDKALKANDNGTDFGIIKSTVSGSEIPLIDENVLKSRIYTIRGVKVMLDADLAEIYGYSTSRFNQQVKNNIERFANDFRFQLTKDEAQDLPKDRLISKMGMRTKSWTQLGSSALCRFILTNKKLKP